MTSDNLGEGGEDAQAQALVGCDGANLELLE